jgi:hypothetical protein
MVSDLGNQSVSMKFHAARTSAEINSRFKGIRPTGIYSGGYLTVANTSHATLSPVIVEISDGTYQVRAETTTSVTVTVNSSTPYIVLRWTYTGSESDYMEVLALAYGSLQANDVIVGHCTFSSGNLIGFSYQNGNEAGIGYDYFYDYRNYAITANNWLKVIPYTPSSRIVAVLPGRVQTVSGTYDVPWQTVQLEAVSNPVYDRIDLIYFDTDTNTIAVYKGVEKSSPAVTPDYAGKMVLAEVMVGSFSITASQIKDVRSFCTSAPLPPDGVTIEADSSGNLKTVDPTYLITRTYGEQLSNVSSWTTLTDLGTNLKRATIGYPVSGIITLPANKRYTLGYTVHFQGKSGNPIVGARFRILSGDVSWSFTDDAMNRSVQYEKIQTTTVSGGVTATLSGSYLFIPTSTSTLSLEILTADSTGAYGAMRGAEVEILGI